MITPFEGPSRPDTVRSAPSPDPKSYGNAKADSIANHLVLRTRDKLLSLEEAEHRVVRALAEIPWMPTIGQIGSYGIGLSKFTTDQIRFVIDRLVSSGQIRIQASQPKPWKPPSVVYVLVNDREVSRG